MFAIYVGVSARSRVAGWRLHAQKGHMQMGDKVILVNAADEAIGEADKLEAHKYPLRRHRAVSVWLYQDQRSGFFRRQHQRSVLLQQRSRHKIVGAEWWGNSICGNVFPKETYVECAHRRLQFELGVTAEVTPVYKFEYQSPANDTYGEFEMDQVYVGELKTPVQANPEEVSDTLWVSVDELAAVVKAWRQAHPEFPTAADSLKRANLDFRQENWSQVLKLAGREITVVPWTMMMLLEPQLWTALGVSS